MFAKVVSGIEVPGMQSVSAWVLGDGPATRFGAAPVGVPTGAGYAVGNRLLDVCFTKTSRSVTELLHAASGEIVAVAPGRR